VDARLPLFPLGTVLFPGAVLPLHVFEERYRLLVRELLDGPEPRRFGVVAIELGHEVGRGAARRLAGVGCTAVLHRATPHPDGRFDLVTVGGERFRITDVDDSGPYLRAAVTMLPDPAGAGPDGPAGQVARLFHRYRQRLADAEGGVPSSGRRAGADAGRPVELPADPVRLSYLVADAILLIRRDKQRLLEAADATVRLVMEADLLIREIRLLSALPAVPAARLGDGGAHPN
jgi:Lon protease-like protein